MTTGIRFFEELGIRLSLQHERANLRNYSLYLRKLRRCLRDFLNPWTYLIVKSRIFIFLLFFFFYCFIRYNSPISEIHQPQFVKSKSMRSRRYPFPSIQYTNVWTGSGDRSVSIYHDSLSRIANNQAENRCVVQRSCKKYVSSWRQQQREWFRMKEKKEEEGERREEKERQRQRERGKH